MAKVQDILEIQDTRVIVSIFSWVNQVGRRVLVVRCSCPSRNLKCPVGIIGNE